MSGEHFLPQAAKVAFEPARVTDAQRKNRSRVTEALVQ